MLLKKRERGKRVAERASARAERRTSLFRYLFRDPRIVIFQILFLILLK